MRLRRARRKGWHAWTYAIGRPPFLFTRELLYNARYHSAGRAGETSSDGDALYAVIVDTLYRLCSPRSVVDIGCSTGVMLHEFAQKGVDVRGVE